MQCWALAGHSWESMLHKMGTTNNRACASDLPSGLVLLDSGLDLLNDIYCWILVLFKLGQYSMEVCASIKTY